MDTPYGIISDTHNHNWSAFSVINSDGVNSRLQMTLDETWRAAKCVKDAGGNTLYHAGDMFHVRGAVAPSVLVPTIETYRRIENELGVRIVVIPGNHDLESNESTFITNASSALKDIGVDIVTEVRRPNRGPASVYLLPWASSVGALKGQLENLRDARIAAGRDPGRYDVIIHAPVDGVITGIPDHGLTPEYLAALGFRRVFSGHYHNHVDFGNGVYSVGALTHQTWGDVGAKAGFLLVGENEVQHIETKAPKFVDLDLTASSGATDVAGNYVRVKAEIEKESKVEELRNWLINDQGAAGVVIHPIRKTAVVARDGSTVKSGASIRQSVKEYIDKAKIDQAEAVARECDNIMADVEAA